MKFSIRNKLIIINALIVITAFVLILFSLQNTLNDRLQEELQKRGIFMARHLAEMSEGDLLTENWINLQLKINEYKRTDNDIFYIFILDNNGNPIAHTFKGGFPLELKRIGSLNKDEPYRIEMIKIDKNLLYNITVPIMDGQLGEINIGLRESMITETARAITRTILAIATLIFFISGAFALYFSSKIVRPLTALEVASREIAKGNLQYRVDINTRDEIGLLAKTFNSMADSINKMHGELAESYRELEEEVEERRAIEAELDRSVRFLNNIYDSIIDPFVIIDRNFRIIKVNNAYASLKNKSVEELINRTCYRELEGRDTVCDGCVIEKTFKSGDPSAKEKKVILSDGSEVWLELYTYPIYDEKNQITHVIEYTRDITDKKKVEEQRMKMIKELERISRTDSLTGLFNRRAVLELLEYNLKRSQRYKTYLSVVLVDIDKFKSINDNYGHPAGDEIIRRVGRIIKDTLRASDLMGRYGGDEFLLILSDTSLEGAMDLSERIRRVVEITDFKIREDIKIKITLSLGVLECTAMTDMEEIIKLVDDALYTSKKSGRNCVYAIES